MFIGGIEIMPWMAFFVVCLVAMVILGMRRSFSTGTLAAIVTLFDAIFCFLFASESGGSIASYFASAGSGIWNPRISEACAILCIAGMLWVVMFITAEAASNIRKKNMSASK